MFTADDVTIEIVDAGGSVALIEISTPVGRGEMIGDIRRVGKTLYVDQVHVGGRLRGQLGRAGINEILRKLLMEADVETLVIQGAVRSTGRYVGKRPRPVVFPH